MIDHRISKPAGLSGYEVHRMVAGLVKGAGVLFVDNGDHVLVRSDLPLTDIGHPLAVPQTNAVLCFELKASVAQRIGRKNVYPELHDWPSRRTWLDAQGKKLGFEVLAAHVQGGRETVADGKGRQFWIDASRFTGVLKVSDSEAFAVALAKGIGRVGKAFGMGMLVI